jgi:hypothetical protein
LVQLLILHLLPFVYADTVGRSFKDVSLMPFGFGTCPCCGTQNSVFRGVKAPMFQALGELAPGAPDTRASAAYVVRWECWHCGRQFETEAMLQGAVR